MAQLQMRLRRSSIACDGGAIRALGLGKVTGFLQRVTVLHPDRRIVRVAVKGLAIKLRRNFPLARIASAVSTTDEAAFAGLKLAPCRPRYRRSLEWPALRQGCRTYRQWLPNLIFTPAELAQF